jgi:hypothetical protein
MTDPAEQGLSSEPATLSFAEAMERSAQWLADWESGELSDEVLADRVGHLVTSREGARGFFVVALTGEVPLMDRLPEPLVFQLRAAGAGVVDLTVRNLAMSTAMALAHGRNGDSERQAASERVQTRSRELLRQLDPAQVRELVEALLAAARDGQGEEVAFLERWGYDPGQREAISTALESV